VCGTIIGFDNGAFGGNDNVFDPLIVINDTNVPYPTRAALADGVSQRGGPTVAVPGAPRAREDLAPPTVPPGVFDTGTGVLIW
jgi:hypothetical protein